MAKRVRSEEVSEFVGYWICADGRIVDRKNGTVMPVYPSGIIRLAKDDGKKSTYSAHRLIAEAFLEQPKGCTFVRFKDGDSSNRSADNLEWTFGVRKVSDRSKEIVGLKLDGLTSVQIAEIFECTPQRINRILKDHHKRVTIGDEHHK